MKTKILKVSTTLSLVIVFLIALLSIGCNKLSETIHDDKAGMNGDFEVVKSGLPVNWLFYTVNTVEEGDFEIIIDKEEYKEGLQSLKFEVKDCSAIGGNKSPGLCQEFDAIPGQAYKVSFWVKNEGAEFIARIGGCAPKTGNVETIVKSKDSTVDWQLIEHEFIIPREYESMRFELNVLQPGSFWVDDIRIEATG